MIAIDIDIAVLCFIYDPTRTVDRHFCRTRTLISCLRRRRILDHTWSHYVPVSYYEYSYSYFVFHLISTTRAYRTLVDTTGTSTRTNTIACTAY
eukprot:scaffold530490_cov22-Prasinocladus_malaysianus.AAC.1